MLRVPFVRVFRLSQEFLLTATYGGRQAVEYLKALDEGRFEKSCKRAQLAHCPKRSNTIIFGAHAHHRGASVRSVDAHVYVPQA